MFDHMWDNSPKREYIWIVGESEDGKPKLEGPYEHLDVATEATEDLSRIQVFRLPTEDRREARRMIRARLRAGTGGDDGRSYEGNEDYRKWLRGDLFR